jgi:hypothetical protein
MGSASLLFKAMLIPFFALRWNVPGLNDAGLRLRVA